MGCPCSKPENEKSELCCLSALLNKVCCCSLCCGRKEDTSLSRLHFNSDPFLEVKSSKLNIRRISRVVSDDSGQSDEDAKSESSSSAHLSVGSDYKKRKKRLIKHSFKKGLKPRFAKHWGAANQYEVYSEEGSADEDKGRKRKKLLKHSPTPSLVSFGRSPDKESHGQKWVDLIKSAKKENRKKVKLGALSVSEQFLAPPGHLQPHIPEDAEKKKFKSMAKTRVSYGSLLNIPTYTDYRTSFSVVGSDVPRSRPVTPAGSSDALSHDSSDQTLEVSVPTGGFGAGLNPGTKTNPQMECFGYLTLAARYISNKVISVSIRSIQGLPFGLGKEGDLTLEIEVVPGGKATWFSIPQIKCSGVRINSDVILRLTSTTAFLQRAPKQEVHLTLWSQGLVWKHCSYGSAITGVGQGSDFADVGIYRHTEGSESAGSLEVGLETKDHPSASSKMLLYVDILRANLLPELIVKYTNKRRDIWCRVTVWCKGKKIHKFSTPKIFLPVSYDPSFRSRAEFTLQRAVLAYTSLVIKILSYKDKGLNETVIGKLILGPHLYLGTSKGMVAHGSLTHWGKVIKNFGSHTTWHSLYL